MQNREQKFSRGRKLKIEKTIERKFSQKHKEALSRPSGEHSTAEPILYIDLTGQGDPPRYVEEQCKRLGRKRSKNNSKLLSMIWGMRENI